MSYHMAFQLVSGNKFLVTFLALKDLMNLQYEYLMIIKYVFYTRSHILSYKRTFQTDCNYSLAWSYANTCGYISFLNYPLLNNHMSPKLKVHFSEQRLLQSLQTITQLFGNNCFDINKICVHGDLQKGISLWTHVVFFTYSEGTIQEHHWVDAHQLRWPTVVSMCLAHVCTKDSGMGIVDLKSSTNQFQ